MDHENQRVTLAKSMQRLRRSASSRHHRRDRLAKLQRASLLWTKTPPMQLQRRQTTPTQTVPTVIAAAAALHLHQVKKKKKQKKEKKKKKGRMSKKEQKKAAKALRRQKKREAKKLKAEKAEALKRQREDRLQEAINRKAERKERQTSSIAAKKAEKTVIEMERALRTLGSDMLPAGIREQFEAEVKKVQDLHNNCVRHANEMIPVKEWCVPDNFGQVLESARKHACIYVMHCKNYVATARLSA